MWVICGNISIEANEVPLSGYSLCILLLLLPVRVISPVFRCQLSTESIFQSGYLKRGVKSRFEIYDV